METLTSSSSRVFSDNHRCYSYSSSTDVVARPEIRFFSSPGHVRVGFSHSISQQFKRIYPVFVSSLSPPSSSSSSPETENLSQIEKPQIQGSSETIHVKFQLQKECAFGEQFLIVGDDPLFGSWDPSCAIPLEWSEGHIWTVELDVPVGKPMVFKFILKGSTGTVLWQPGPDRVLQTWETKNMIRVSEDWINADLQMLIEEEPTTNPRTESTSNSEMPIIAENMSQPGQAMKGDVNGEIASKDTITSPKGKPFLEKSMAIVAENIGDLVREPMVQKQNELFDEESSACAKEVGRVLHEHMDTEKDSNNGSALKSFRGKKDEEKVVSYQGDPVLVLGLTPFATVRAEETSQSELNESIVANDSDGVDEATDPKVPEKELEKGSLHLKDSTEMFTDGEELQGNEQVEKQQLSQEQDEPNSTPFGSGVLDSDLQWGRRILQKLLSSFGFLQHQVD